MAESSSDRIQGLLITVGLLGAGAVACYAIVKMLYESWRLGGGADWEVIIGLGMVACILMMMGWRGLVVSLRDGNKPADEEKALTARRELSAVGAWMFAILFSVIAVLVALVTVPDIVRGDEILGISLLFVVVLAALTLFLAVQKTRKARKRRRHPVHDAGVHT